MHDSHLLDPVPLLRDLIRIETVNPPGDEGRLVAHLERLLIAEGITDYKVVGPSAERTNLVVRFPGRGEAPPLLLHAHSDVVPVTGQEWTHPPFEGRLVDGEVWGRGAIDMKGGLAMMLSALFRLRAAGERPAGDVVLAVVADEEDGSGAGAAFLVEQYPELFEGVRYAIGEEGGAGIELAGIRFHPVVVAEKRPGWLRLTLRGPGGHASRLAAPGNPTARLGAVLTALSGARLPRHQMPAADRMLAALAGALPEPLAGAVTRLREDRGGDAPPAGLPLNEALQLDSVLRHTVNPTVVRTGHKINMMPAEITVDVDGRILPGEFEVADLVAEIRALIGGDGEDADAIGIELLHEDPRVRPELIAEPEFGPFYDRLEAILREADPEAVPLPVMSPATTDATVFARLGIRCYGWLPLLLPAGAPHRRLLHCADERIPVTALEFGTRCLTELLRTYP
ncbi:M20/M25/M40 family metallo-hydrolase [Streptomyces sp. NBC_01006]|uniref:M20/M25/M40 family metallo-hydrolase n=1 Tax=Streptomyces sp. NBC_01006 TaxID=2903716 RepID=UPI002F90ED1E|nr:M20/M25/M40 family metallo-hydrolase [Streptomyces sp. NBC_01006]